MFGSICKCVCLPWHQHVWSRVSDQSAFYFALHRPLLWLGFLSIASITNWLCFVSRSTNMWKLNTPASLQVPVKVHMIEGIMVHAVFNNCENRTLLEHIVIWIKIYILYWILFKLASNAPRPPRPLTHTQNFTHKPLKSFAPIKCRAHLDRCPRDCKPIL